jgi:CO/xanthine dehydrogenase FAD-binding subunit
VQVFNKDDELLFLFDKLYSRLDWETRLTLPEGVSTWLHGFFSSHREPFDHKIETLAIGAGLTLESEEDAQLAEAARTVGSPQIRATGSLGGNLGTCSPAGDSLPVLSALDAIVHLQSQKTSRSISFADFMVGPKRNSRLPDEIITGVTIPLTNGYQGYAKVGVRNAMVISVASVCVAIHDGEVRVALGSVGPIIIRCSESEAWINSVGLENVDHAIAKEFGDKVRAESRPIDDHRSTAEYRRHAVGVLSTRLLLRGVGK